MLEYENRLIAELRIRGADEQVVADARASLQDFPADEAVLVSEFGEPESYARSLTPGKASKGRYGFAVAGAALCLATWVLLKLAREANWEPIASWGPLVPLVSLIFLPLGVFAEGLRRQRLGRS